MVAKTSALALLQPQSWPRMRMCGFRDQTVTKPQKRRPRKRSGASFQIWFVVRLAGLEPATPGFEAQYSIR